MLCKKRHCAECINMLQPLILFLIVSCTLKFTGGIFCLLLGIYTYFSLHRILNNNKIQELRNGSFYGLFTLEKL